ncbi:hypothetical protein AX774_g2687 [Zancudomyces culisetae]|uniref:Uncharacterized protein n=1 Tax=Zancudomyces culisetae TaxID=1213189 RepID=A0A1R1PS48_ZANCU|nr:hypothetical protein AX774_g2687 [Zancudomyces culisetae]|eukprot:OMH83805.1 hypothetical protein AX774_g2687 [Zancudomyces culisetae]
MPSLFNRTSSDQFSPGYNCNSIVFKTHFWLTYTKYTKEHHQNQTYHGKNLRGNVHFQALFVIIILYSVVVVVVFVFVVVVVIVVVV